MWHVSLLSKLGAARWTSARWTSATAVATSQSNSASLPTCISAYSFVVLNALSGHSMKRRVGADAMGLAGNASGMPQLAQTASKQQVNDQVALQPLNIHAILKRRTDEQAPAMQQFTDDGSGRDAAMRCSLSDPHTQRKQARVIWLRDDVHAPCVHAREPCACSAPALHPRAVHRAICWARTRCALLSVGHAPDTNYLRKQVGHAALACTRNAVSDALSSHLQAHTSDAGGCQSTQHCCAAMSIVRWTLQVQHKCQHCSFQAMAAAKRRAAASLQRQHATRCAAMQA